MPGPSPFRAGMVNLAAMLWRRLLRKRWVLAVVFGLSLVYFLSSTFKQVSGPRRPPVPRRLACAARRPCVLGPGEELGLQGAGRTGVRTWCDGFFPRYLSPLAPPRPSPAGSGLAGGVAVLSPRRGPGRGGAPARRTGTPRTLGDVEGPGCPLFN